MHYLLYYSMVPNIKDYICIHHCMVNGNVDTLILTVPCINILKCT